MLELFEFLQKDVKSVKDKTINMFLLINYKGDFIIEKQLPCRVEL